MAKPRLRRTEIIHKAAHRAAFGFSLPPLPEITIRRLLCLIGTNGHCVSDALAIKVKDFNRCLV